MSEALKPEVAADTLRQLATLAERGIGVADLMRALADRLACDHDWQYADYEYGGRSCPKCGASESSEGLR